jgi:hypothetical protein
VHLLAQLTWSIGGLICFLVHRRRLECWFSILEGLRRRNELPNQRRHLCGLCASTSPHSVLLLTAVMVTSHPAWRPERPSLDMVLNGTFRVPSLKHRLDQLDASMSAHPSCCLLVDARKQKVIQAIVMNCFSARVRYSQEHPSITEESGPQTPFSPRGLGPLPWPRRWSQHPKGPFPGIAGCRTGSPIAPAVSGKDR